MHRFKRVNRGRQGGFSLIEMLVATTISLFLLGALVALMASSRKSYEVNDYSARMQENARFAIQFLSFDLRMAGFFGCASTGGNIEGKAPTTYGDVVEFSYAQSDTVTSLEDPAVDGATLIKVDDIAGFAANQFISIADCGGASVVQIQTINSSNKTFTVTPALTRNFEIDNTEIRPFNTWRYQVQINPNGVPALYRVNVVTSAGEEIVEGVEYMRFLYGEDTDADGAPDVYRPVDEVTNWGAVSSIRTGLLVRSVSNYDPSKNPNRELGNRDEKDSGTYNILDLRGGSAVTPPQGNLRVRRRVFTNTIFTRNQA